jgi:hypothetical protein
VPRAAPQIGHRGTKVDDDTVVGQELPILRRKHRSPAGGKNDIAALHEAAEHTGFTGAETRLPFDLEYHGDPDPGRALDLVVGVEKCLAEALREQPPDRSLACPHEAHQKDVPGAPGAAGRPGL